VAAPATHGQLRRLVKAAEQLDDRALLASSRCFGWTRADVLAHSHLALQDMLLALVDPTDAEPDTDAASYWRAEPPSNDPGSDELDTLRFARLLASASAGQPA
jgi:Mycothiol maleylpyruvate isomerase N-terminal domain